MTKKWNLQDIQPANRPRRAPKRMQAQAERQRSAAPAREPVDMEDGEEVPVRKVRAAAKKPAPAMERRRPARRPEPEVDAADHFDTIEIIDGNATKKRKFFVAAFVFFAIVFGGVITSAMTGGADVEVFPRHIGKNISANFTAANVAKDNTIRYELLSIEADGERQVKASGQETVTKQAEGTILIYNEYSTSPIRLVKNTRFETTDGKIYKIKESAVVPGYTEDADGKMIRGVVTADVFAEEAGEDYNRGPATFRIPGFKGYDEYESVYAESTGEITGGFSGKKFIIDEAELETARQALHMELRDALLKKLESQIPAGFVLYDDAVTFTYESKPAVAYGDDLATIKERGVLRVPIFKENTFAGFLAAQSVKDYAGLPVRLADYQSLKFSYSSATTTISDISAATELDFKLTGSATIIWEFDENTLKADLLGVEKSKISDILKKYPAIDKATAEVRPFWKTSFPREMSEITITETVE